MGQRLLLHIGRKLRNQQGVLDTDVSSGEGIGCGLCEVQELEAFSDERSSLSRFRCYLLNGVIRTFSVQQSAKPLRLLERMYVGPLNILDDLNFKGLLIAECSNAHRDFVQPCPLRGTVAPRPRHDFKVSVDSPHEEWGEDAFAANAPGQFLKPLLVKHLARIRT